MATTKKKVVILGGGLAGLSAAYELTKKNFDVVIIEKWEELGGLARTIKKGKFAFDTGPHRWYTKSNMVNDWMLSLLGDEVIRVPRLTRIYFDKKFFYYPIKLKNAIGGIGLWKAFRSVFDYGVARIKGRLTKPKLVTMEDGYVNQFGKTLFETFFKRYSEKLWGVDCDQISVDWIGQRTRGLNLSTIIKEMFVKSKKVVSLVDEFSYPELGIGRLAEKMGEFVIKNKGTILLDSEVMSFTQEKGRIKSVEVKTKKGTRTISGDYFISSIPINDLVNRIKPKLPAEIISTAKKLTYRDELQVALFITKTHITPDTWIYVHPKEIPYMRLMEMDNWSDKLSPPGTTSLVFEIACTEGDSMWNRDDRDVVEMVKKSFVEEFGLITMDDIVGGVVHRVPKEYPVYHIGYRQDVDKIKRYLSTHIANLQLIGRNGTFRYNNMDHSVEMGLYAAWNLIEGRKKYNIDSVNIEREYLEEKKIEEAEDELVEEKH
jgi:protoporphyrinogen oxidase